MISRHGSTRWLMSVRSHFGSRVRQRWVKTNKNKPPSSHIIFLDERLEAQVPWTKRPFAVCPQPGFSWQFIGVLKKFADGATCPLMKLALLLCVSMMIHHLLRPAHPRLIIFVAIAVTDATNIATLEIHTTPFTCVIGIADPEHYIGTNCAVPAFQLGYRFCACFFQSGGPTLKQAMVVVKGGFRDRWNRQGSSRRYGVTDDRETHHADECTDSLNCFDFLNPLDDGYDEGLIVDLDLQSQSEQIWDGPAKIYPPVLEPRPKSRPQVAASDSSIRYGIKRTADDFSFYLLHECIADLKLPRQKGLLASVFSRREAFWDKPGLGALSSCVGVADHIASNNTVAGTPNHSNSWKPQSCTNEPPELCQLMMTTGVYPQQGLRPWCYWTLMPSAWYNPFLLLVGPFARRMTLHRFSLMLSPQSHQGPSSRDAMRCGGFQFGCRTDRWAPPSIKGKM